MKAKAHVGAAGVAREALSAVSFSLDQGMVGAIVGPSGCGKTTLLRIIAGLDRNFAGSVERGAFGRMAVVFQEPRLLPWRSVEQNVRLVAPRMAEAQLAALFASMGLSGHRRHFPGELSLGLARRVALARALSADPDLLLLDEPFASLDEATALGLVEQITDVIEARKTTTLVVAHDIDMAIRLADVVYVLSTGPGRLLAEIRVPKPRRRLTIEAGAQIRAQIAAAR